MAKNILIMGAAGRDFHLFNTCFRDNSKYCVRAFTAAQIPGIAGRKYPPVLAGRLYPDGIPIHHENDLADLIDNLAIDEVIFAYSDISYDYINERKKLVEQSGAEFHTFADNRTMLEKTMLKSTKPIIAVCAVRTGSGKSPVSRKIAGILLNSGKRVVVVRHPMPYGDLETEAVQRFEKLEDMAAHNCTIEEMEEYEPHLQSGIVVYAGVDYEKILREAEKEADVIIWDGGNNDLPFYRPDLHITIVDPLRAGHETCYFPGSINLQLADVLIVNKVDQATREQLETVIRNIIKFNPAATVIEARMPLTVTDADLIEGKKVLVVEDGPSLTHGQMKFGAGVIAARAYGASEIIDPRPWVTGTIADTFLHYPAIGPLLPAMGYSEQQIKDLEETINRTPADTIIIATPVNLTKLIKIDKPYVRVTYGFEEVSSPTLAQLIASIF